MSKSEPGPSREELDAWLSANCGTGLPYFDRCETRENALHGLAYILRQINATNTYRPLIGQGTSATSAIQWVLDHFATEALRPIPREISEPKWAAGPWRLDGDLIRGGADDNAVGSPLGDTAEQALANGHIQAAATDLYEALAEAEAKLRILAEVAEDVRLEGAPQIRECADRAAAALSKANPYPEEVL